MAEVIEFPISEDMELTGRTIVTINLGRGCDDDGNETVKILAEMEREHYFAICQMARMLRAPNIEAALCAHVLSEAHLLDGVVAIARPRRVATR